MNIDTWPPDGSSPIFIRGYHARSYELLIEEFHRDALLLLDQGYVPVGQHYVEEQWGFWWGLLGLVLIPFLVGFLIWAQLLTTRRIGTLTVTYMYQARRTAAGSSAQ